MELKPMAFQIEEFGTQEVTGISADENIQQNIRL